MACELVDSKWRAPLRLQSLLKNSMKLHTLLFISIFYFRTRTNEQMNKYHKYRSMLLKKIKVKRSFYSTLFRVSRVLFSNRRFKNITRLSLSNSNKFYKVTYLSIFIFNVQTRRSLVVSRRELQI